MVPIDPPYATPPGGNRALFGFGQRQYLPLPGIRHCDEKGIITTCWSMSFRERIRALISGKIVCQVMTFDRPIQPQKLIVVGCEDVAK